MKIPIYFFLFTSLFIIIFLLIFTNEIYPTIPSFLHFDIKQTKRATKGIIPTINHLYKHPGLNVIDTTTPQVPELFDKLLREIGYIDKTESNSYPALNSVLELEKIVGWDPIHSKFVNNSKIISLQTTGLGGMLQKCYSDKKIFLSYLLNGTKLEDIFDIVIPTIRDLDFLEAWKPFIKNFHIILIQDGDPKKILKIPEWADYELYNRNDIKQTLKDDSWIISEKDASIRNFGFLVSSKPFIWSVDDDCFPASHPNGNLVDAISEHAINLLTPSTPYFFNTVYDPYKPCVDFVRGYPYSLRRGVQTAVSHGLWMNMYDYDAPTQLLKVSERNDIYADITQTIPKGVLYPLCSMNVAFNKKLLGPAVMQGLMGVGQPWGRYDDMFSGWASKVVADHLELGTKSGAPYILHKKASNPFTNLAKEYMGLQWQEEIIRVFDSISFSKDSDNPSKVYLELANIVESRLSHLSPYFLRLADAMKKWVRVWDLRERNLLPLTPSRRNIKITSYSSRYHDCIKARESYSKIELRRWIHERARPQPHTLEIAVLRIGKWSNTTDFWNSVCAFSTEASSKNISRNVYLHVMEQFYQNIPEEFRDISIPQNMSDIISKFPDLKGRGDEKYIGIWNGDIIISDFILSISTNFLFAWVFEEDCRYSSRWSNLFDKHKNFDLVTWGKFNNSQFTNTAWWHLPKFYHGRWSTGNYSLEGAWTMGFGISVNLTRVICKNALEGTWNRNQEVNLPTSAIEMKMRIKYVEDQQMEWKCCHNYPANIAYRKFQDDDIGPSDFLYHKVWTVEMHGGYASPIDEKNSLPVIT